ncbi:MAG: hypothetical protein IPF54_09175 [Draconibacterium sp.]|nr:hypothetical protein [Draconibacterium sp.]
MLKTTIRNSRKLERCRAFARNALPTEANCSAQNSDNKFSWGNQVSENGKYFTNTWQGT